MAVKKSKMMDERESKEFDSEEGSPIARDRRSERASRDLHLRSEPR